MPGPEKTCEQLTQEIEELRRRLAHAENEKTRAEAALRQIETRFEAFLDNSPCVAFLKDQNGRYVYGNAGLQRLLALNDRSFLGKIDYDLFPHAIVPRLRENDAAVLASGQCMETIEVVPTTDGTLRSWLAMKFPVAGESGEQYLGGVAIDITERIEAAKELERQNLILQSILDSMAEGVIVADKEGRFLLLNRAAEKIAGVGRIDATPDGWVQQFGIFLPDGVTPMPIDEVPLTRAIRGEEIESIELFLNNKEMNEGKWLNVSGSPLRSKDGKQYGGVVVFRDVTERYLADQKVKEYSKQLQTLSRRLLQIQEEERRHLARELHDEVGQMLTGLKLMFERVALEQHAETKAAFGNAIRLVQDLMARVRGMSMQLRPSLLDDLGLVPALEWQFKHYTEQTGLQVISDLANISNGGRMPPEVETAAYRIVQEALTNVARHTQVNEVIVRLQRKNDILLLQIEDQGAGFDANAIWESSGISGMKERATLLGGTLVVQSTPGAGTRIFARLPVSGGR